MRRGFSTLEMLIAMAILLSAFTAVILLSSAQSFSIDTQTSAEALSLARKTLETEQSLGRKDFKLVVATSTSETLGNITYTKKVDVTQPDLFTKKVTVKVTWPGTFGRSPSTSLTALLTNFANATGADTCSSVLTDTTGAHGNWKTPVSIDKRLGQDILGDNTGLYPITGIDAYQKRLYVTVSTPSTTVGPNSASAGATDSAVGSNPWSSFGNLTTSDSLYATATLGSSGQITYYLRASKFNFAIPQGATIQGIKVEIQRKGSSSSNLIKDYKVQIVKPDGTVGSLNQAHSTSWPTSDAYDTYGNTTDLWGEQWTPAKINNTNFGVVLAATTNGGSSSRTASVNHVRITVYYTQQFYILDVSNPGTPAFIGGLATSTLTGGLNALVIATSTAGNYAYAATSASTGTNQLQVIDVTDPTAPFVKGTFPSAAGTGMGQGTGISIYYRDGYVYEGLKSASGPEFNIIDVAANPAVPVWKGGYTVGSNVNAIYVKDGFAYLTTNDTSKELVILNITNPAAPSFVTNYNALPDNGTNAFGFGRALYMVGDSLFMGRSWVGNLANAPEYLLLDTSGTSPTPVASKDVGPNTTSPYSVNGLVVRDSLAFLLLGSGSNSGQLQIINATSTAQYATPIALPSGSTGVGGVALDCEGNYLYAASVDSSNKGWISSVTGQ